MSECMFPDGDPIEIGEPRVIKCPDDQPHHFKEQTTVHPMQGGPVVEAPVIRRRLEVKWGCTGLSSVYRSACPLCDAQIHIDRPIKLFDVEGYDVRVPGQARTRAWHNWDGDNKCPLIPVLNDLGKFEVRVEAVQRTSVPWWAYYEFEENVTAFLKQHIKEKMDLEV